MRPFRARGVFLGAADTRVPVAPFAIAVGPVGAGMQMFTHAKGVNGDSEG